VTNLLALGNAEAVMTGTVEKAKQLNANDAFYGETRLAA